MIPGAAMELGTPRKANLSSLGVVVYLEQASVAVLVKAYYLSSYEYAMLVTITGPSLRAIGKATVYLDVE
jgi:hypothetical protein